MLTMPTNNTSSDEKSQKSLDILKLKRRNARTESTKLFNEVKGSVDSEIDMFNLTELLDDAKANYDNFCLIETAIKEILVELNMQYTADDQRKFDHYKQQNFKTIERLEQRLDFLKLNPPVVSSSASKSNPSGLILTKDDLQDIIAAVRGSNDPKPVKIELPTYDPEQQGGRL